MAPCGRPCGNFKFVSTVDNVDCRGVLTCTSEEYDDIFTTRSFLPRLSLTASCSTSFARTAQGYDATCCGPLISSYCITSTTFCRPCRNTRHTRWGDDTHVGALHIEKARTEWSMLRKCEGIARRPIFLQSVPLTLSLSLRLPTELLSTQPSACNLQSYKDRLREQPKLLEITMQHIESTSRPSRHVLRAKACLCTSYLAFFYVY